MSDYRCYFFRDDGVAVAWCPFESDSDGGAHDHAMGLLIGHPLADTIEVWDMFGLTLRANRPALQTPAKLRNLCRLAIAAVDKEDDLDVKRSIASRAFALAQEAEALERRQNKA